VSIGIREQKRRTTRAAVAATAMRLFRDRGFDGTTIDGIAAAAAVSPRTVFRYFGTKEEILFSTDEEHLAQFLEIIRRTRPEPTLEGLAPALLEFARSLESDRDLLTLRTEVIGAHPRLLAREALVRRDWEDGLAGELAGVRQSLSEPPARMLAATALAVLTEAVRQWLAGEGPPPLDAVTRTCLDTAARVLAPA
jgi:AcrR family transcriptional regulator